MRLQIGFRPTAAQQREADIEAARRIGIELRPAIDDDQPVQPLRRQHGQREADDAAKGMAQKIDMTDLELVHEGKHVARHILDGSGSGRLALAPSGAAMVIGDDAEMRGERRNIGRPIA